MACENAKRSAEIEEARRAWRCPTCDERVVSWLGPVAPPCGECAREGRWVRMVPLRFNAAGKVVR